MMSNRHSQLASRIALAALLIAPAACGDEPAVEEEVVVAEPTPEERLAAAVAAWNASSAFHFDLLLENRSVPLDPNGLLTYTAAQGDVVAPDRLQAQTTVRTPVGNAAVAFIGIGDQQWLTNPLTRQWEAAPPDAAGAVANIFNPDTGIGAMLGGMTNLEYHPDETLDGTPVFRLSGTLPGTVLAGFAPDLATVETLGVDLYVTPEDSRIHRIVVREPANPEGAVPTWTFNFSAFDQPVAIEPPL